MSIIDDAAQESKRKIGVYVPPVSNVLPQMNFDRAGNLCEAPRR